MLQVKVSPSGIRGRVDQGLELGRVIDLVSAFATWIDGAPVLVARDTRPSSPMIASAVRAALAASGSTVLDAGICPTAMAQAEAARQGVGGAISVTASHSDARWNGLKLFGESGRVLGSVEGHEVLDLWHQGEHLKVPFDHLGTIRDLDDVVERYLQDLLRTVDCELIARAGLRVVIDAANGAGGMVLPLLCHQLHVELIPVACEPTGDFLHPPDPTARNLSHAAAIVVPVAAHAGFGFSSDCERVSLITDRGLGLGTGATLPLVLAGMGDQGTDPEAAGVDEAVGHGATGGGYDRFEPTVVTSVCSDSRVDRIAAARGMSVARCGVGVQAVIEHMLAERAVLGGETSGGVALAGWQHAFDGVAVLVRLLQQIAAAGNSSQALADALPEVHFRSVEVPCRVSHAYSAVARLRSRACGEGQVTDLDGVRVDLASSSNWYHLRVSQTEPVVRVTCEAETAQQADELIALLARRVRAAIHE